MAVVITGLTAGHAVDSGSETIGNQNTATVQFNANTLLLVFVGQNKPSSFPTVPNVSGGGITWNEVSSVNVGGSGKLRGTLFWGICTTQAIAALTIQVNENQQNLYWSISQVSGNELSALFGGILQGNIGSGIAQTALSANLVSPLANPNNASFGAVYYNTFSAITNGSGYTDVIQSISSHGTDAEYAQKGSQTVNWTTLASDYVACSVEIKAAVSGLLLGADI